MTGCSGPQNEANPSSSALLATAAGSAEASVANRNTPIFIVFSSSSCLWFYVPLLVTPTLLVSAQLFQQCLGLLQIFGVKPLGEPAVDLGQELARFFPLALLLPKAAQAHHRSQL